MTAGDQQAPARPAAGESPAPVKVLTIIDSLGFGGAERLLVTLAASAPGAGLELAVASLHAAAPGLLSTVPALQAAGVQPSFLGVDRLLGPGAVARVAEAIRDSGCDVVHAHLGYSATLVPLAARRAGRPSVCTLHTLPVQGGPRERVKERLCVEAAGRSNAFVFVSEAARRAYAARYRPRPSWRVLPNGVDLATWHPGPGRLPAGLGVPPGAPVVSIVAALRRPKGHALAVDAWPSVLAAQPEARLLVVGDGEEEASLRARVARAGLEDRVLFLGRLDDERDTAEVVRASDLVLLPSETEALPTTLIEAAACGTPVVATDVGGVREVVDDGATGLVVPPRAAGPLAAAVGALLADPGRRAAMGRAASEVARERFDRRVWADRLRALYVEAIQQQGRRRPRDGRSGP
jgi:glycosyltransferase involved in cell wall biosynthesis